MMKLIRSNAPQWLSDNWERWSKSYRSKLEDNNRDNNFVWATHEREKVNHKLLPLLRTMTKDHCSFCDGFPMQSRIGDTIEHFKPKTKFPLESYKWENLFLCCSNCQKKNEDFDEKLLKPDDVKYEFSKYFDYNYQTGELKPIDALHLNLIGYRCRF